MGYKCPNCKKDFENNREDLDKHFIDNVECSKEALKVYRSALMGEFNLSNLVTKKNQLGVPANVYFENDVKEFIRLLKTEILNDWINPSKSENKSFVTIMLEKIDKLAGDRLK